MDRATGSDSDGDASDVGATTPAAMDTDRHVSPADRAVTKAARGARAETQPANAKRAAGGAEQRMVRCQTPSAQRLRCSASACWPSSALDGSADSDRVATGDSTMKGWLSRR
jgi:hypothetical protein